MQCIAIALGTYGSYIIWDNFAALKAGGNFDDSLGIYRISAYNDDYRLFNVSDMIPINGTTNDTFIYLENIPSEEFEGTGFKPDIYCLSEFEYRSEEFQIYFNTMMVSVISVDGQFCTTSSGPHDDMANFCFVFYTLQSSVLCYASINPITQAVERFDHECLLLRFQLTFSTPKVDLSIDATKHFNQMDYSQNGEDLVIYYPRVYQFVPVSLIFTSFEDPKRYYDVFHILGVHCAVHYSYDLTRSQIHFNYREVRYSSSGTECSCSSLSPETTATNCSSFHQNPKYSYITADSFFEEYTSCYGIPTDKLAPQYDPDLYVTCPNEIDACGAFFR